MRQRRCSAWGTKLDSTHVLLAASPGVRHQENPSCAHGDRDSIVPAPDGAFLTSGEDSSSFLAGRFPVLLQCSPDRLPVLRGRFHHYFFTCCSISQLASNRSWSGLLPNRAVQTGTHLRLLRPLRPQAASFYERRFPLSCKSGLFPPRLAHGGLSTSALEREQAACPACTVPWKRWRLAPPTPSGLALLGPHSSASASFRECVGAPNGITCSGYSRACRD